MTTATMPSKDAAAETLARAHFDIESGIHRIFRIVGTSEQNPREPIKLLEINSNTVASGIIPIGFGPLPADGIAYPSIIIVITPEEFEKVQQGRLLLPNGWTIGREYLKQWDGDAPNHHT